MNQLIAQAAELQRVVDARGWRSCIIGGLAVVRWGEPRLTRDVDIDIALAGFSFEAEIIDRATAFEYVPGTSLRTASAEDLIVLKAFASRRRDWSDIAGIIARQRSLDWNVITDRLSPLAELKGEPEILLELEQIRAEAEEGV